MKLFIVLAAPGGSGKTTTSKMLVGSQETCQEFTEVREYVLQKAGRTARKCSWTLGAGDIGIAGSWKSGTDSNVGPAIVKDAMYEVIKHKNICIIDGYMSTPQWVVAINEWQSEHPHEECHTLFVQYHISLEENVRRIAQRRDIPVEQVLNNKSKMDTLRGNQRRPLVVKQHFENSSNVPVTYINVTEDMNPQQVTKHIQTFIDAIVEAYNE